MARRLINFIFFQNEKNFNALGKNSESMRNLKEGKDEMEVI